MNTVKVEGALGFRELVRYSTGVRRKGWFATRQQMIKEGGSLQDVARVLVWQLNILGADARQTQTLWAKGSSAQIKERSERLAEDFRKMGGRLDILDQCSERG